MSSLLSKYLDAIRDSLDKKLEASKIAANLPEIAVTKVAYIHLSGLLNTVFVESSSFELGEHRYGNQLVELIKNPLGEDIVYLDRDIRFSSKGINLEKHDGPKMLSDLLQLLQYARDESQELYYRPPEERERIIQWVAEDFGASTSMVKFFCANSSFIEKS